MEFNKSVIDIIKQRTSIRSYNGESMTDVMKERLSEYCSNVKGPFDVNVRFKVIDSETVSRDNEVKLGTYGVIKGTGAFIAAAVERRDLALLELGYELEKIILYATSLDLGTCWLGGTFKRGEFGKVMELKDNEILPIITPVGYPKENRRLVDRMMRLVAGSNNRKQFKELFFNRDFSETLKEAEAEKYTTPLEMLRLAPSASNKQPWRVVKDNNSLHFYLRHDKGYSENLGYDIQKIDIGIAMSHFELSAVELGIIGEWRINKSNIENVPDNTEYMVSWLEEE